MSSGCKSGAGPTPVAVNVRPKALRYKMTALIKHRTIKMLIMKLLHLESLVARCYKMS